MHDFDPQRLLSRLRFKHLQKLGNAWAQEKLKARMRKSGQAAAEEPQPGAGGALYVGKLQLCVPLE